MDTQPKNTNWIRAIALIAITGLVASLATLAFSGTAPEAQATPEPTQSTTTTVVAVKPPGVAFELPAVDEVPESTGTGAAAEVETEDAPAQDEPAPDDDQDEPAPEPSPANLVAPDEVATDADGKAHIKLTNSGDEDLVFQIVDLNGAPILPVVLPTTIFGGDSEMLVLQVLEGGLPLGEYEFHVTVKTTGGNETVAITGFKGLVIIPTADLDIQDQVVVNHGVPVFTVKMTNNEDHNVTVSLATNDDRLSIPDEVELTPGVNVVWMSVAPAPVPQFLLNSYSFTVSWDLAEVEVQVTKFGS